MKGVAASAQCELFYVEENIRKEKNGSTTEILTLSLLTKYPIKFLAPALLVN
jgi:hypothetical protein